MTKANRPNRKVSDEDIIAMNSVGLSLATIAENFNCHQTTISLRLKAMNIEPADTRRAFMEDIVKKLSPEQQSWLVEQLGPTISIKNFVENLIVKEFISKTQPTKKVANEPNI